MKKESLQGLSEPLPFEREGSEGLLRGEVKGGIEIRKYTYF